MEIAEDLRQSEAYGRYIESIGWKTVRTPQTGVRVFVREFGPVGFVKIQRFATVPKLVELAEVFTKFRVFTCKLEPGEKIGETGQKEIGRMGFKRGGSPFLGTKTLRVDLRPSEEQIRQSFKKDCRYCLRRAEARTDNQIRINEFDRFYAVWKLSAKRKGLWIPSPKECSSLINCFGKNVFSLTAGDLAGCLILIHKKTAFYYYAGATRDGVGADLPYLIVWEAMKQAKTLGCQVWDFEGIYDARQPNKGWLGFSHFKKSFGGKEIEYPGPFEKWRWPF
jgi:lipid II:glycine glycyltransferase (peptidoglycan interpeptide bridge formation enzyme)